MEDLKIAKKLIQLSNSAKERNIDFNLSFKHVKKLLNQKNCYYTKVRFDDSINNADYNRSIDRINSSIGYTDNNTVACTISFNGRKSNISIADIELLYKKLILKK